MATRVLPRRGPVGESGSRAPPGGPSGGAPCEGSSGVRRRGVSRAGLLPASSSFAWPQASLGCVGDLLRWGVCVLTRQEVVGPGPGGTGETQRLGQMGLHTQRTRWRCCVGLPGRALPPASPPSQGRPRPPQPGAACSSPALSPAALQVLLGSEVSEKHHSPLAPAFPLKRSLPASGDSAENGSFLTVCARF
ncbi:unnamed protein product [Rangifer tarandus platyrhynchus]|uniref:Uncharacterized protein n=1 Tax=Rangifer tarandus platyrhynchus TaxID=3082113 RepID=A0AC59ZSB3_RANTA